MTFRDGASDAFGVVRIACAVMSARLTLCRGGSRLRLPAVAAADTKDKTK